VIAGLTEVAPPPTRPPTATKAPSPTLAPPTTEAPPAETATPVPEAILVDDFTSYTGWAIGENDGFAFGFADGGYFIRVDSPNVTIWSTKSQELTDASLQTIAQRKSGPANGYFGVSCRHQQDGYNYYILVIGSDGFYGIGMMYKGKLSFLQEGKDDTEIIKRDVASNLIQGNCIGQTLSLYTNGHKLLEIQDETFTSGLIGLVAGTHLDMGQESLYVLFDNFIVLQP
jgi:hypothetical protein